MNVIDKKILIKFRDLKISKTDLFKAIPKELHKKPIDKPLEVCSSHVINLLEQYQKGYITKECILDWVNTIWFSGWYEYCDEQSDSIASVVNELEEIDEIGKNLTLEKVERYIYVLKNNLEV